MSFPLPFRRQVADPVLEQEALLGLRSVATFLSWAYVVMACLWAILWVLPAPAQSRLTLATTGFNFGLAEIYLVLVLAAEVACRFWIDRTIRRQGRFPRGVTFLVAGLESFQPTFFLLLWGLFLPPQAALSQSPIFFYFLLIAVNALRQDPAVALFSGLVALVGYDGLAYYLFAQSGHPDPLRMLTSDHASKGVYLFLCGAMTAFIAHQMRVRMAHSLGATQAMEDLERDVKEREMLAIFRERERLTQELHDSAAQKLGFLSLQAEALGSLASQGKVPELSEGLRKVVSVAEEAQDDIRNFLQDTQASQVLAKGFLVSLRDVLRRFEAESGILLTIEGDEAAWEARVPASRRVETFKIVEEALANIAKQSGTRQAWLSFRQEAAAVQIVITDRGKGFDWGALPPDSPFGLETMRRRAALAGGTLSVDASPGAGARVTLEFPGQAPGKKPATEAPLRILVADGHRLFQEGLVSLLQSGGYEVAGMVSTGEEAVARAREQRPDIVLMDIQMAGMDGLMATRVLREERPDLKVIILTASASVPLVHEAMKAGASGYLLKGARGRELFDLIDGVGSGTVVLTPEMADRLLKEFPPQVIADGDPRLEQLSSRQVEVLQWAAAGLTYKEIGQKLFISERTIKFHMAEVVEKLGVKDRAEAIQLVRKKPHYL